MNAALSKRIDQIISDSNCTSYVITGYKLTETRLVLNFYDCKQVFDFNITGKNFDEYKLVNKFFTANYDQGDGDKAHEARMKELEFFKSLNEREVPESKELV
jgi:hypothetical protein